MNASPLSERIESLAIALRLATALPRFLRAAPTSQGARAVIGARLATRAGDFLALAREQIFDHPQSPYLPLLRHVGCEFEDLRQLVQRDGLDDALRTLWRRGVYLGTDELKGHKPIRRGSLTYTVTPKSFRNRTAARHMTVASSGSTGPVRGHLLDLDTLRELSVNYGLGMEALGNSPDAYAAWDTAGPVMTATFLWFTAYFGHPPRRAFRMDTGGGATAGVRASGAIVAAVGRALGVRFPTPQAATLADPLPVLRWLETELRSGARPGLRTFPTSAMRLAQVAIDRGIDLTNALVVVSGEPLTAARLAAIRRSGLSVASLYGASECGSIGYSCQSPTEVDEVHVQSDLHALLRLDAGEARGLFPEGALLMTSLRRSARLILLNASLGDTAVQTARDCGCRLQEIGWTTHLHTIRSFEKLNSAGMTFRGHDVLRVLEEVLPRRFGGTPADYQLVEGESDSGAPRVTLRIHPALGDLDHSEVKRVFLAAVGQASDVNAVMAKLWSEADVVRVQRQAPVASAGGKLSPFQRDTGGDRD